MQGEQDGLDYDQVTLLLLTMRQVEVLVGTIDSQGALDWLMG